MRRVVATTHHHGQSPHVTCMFLCNSMLPATCCRNSNQFEFMQHVAATFCHTHILSPHVTCACDMSLQQLLCK